MKTAAIQMNNILSAATHFAFLKPIVAPAFEELPGIRLMPVMAVPG